MVLLMLLAMNEKAYQIGYSISGAIIYIYIQRSGAVCV